MICRMSKARARTRASKIPSLGWNGVDGSHLLVLGDHESLRKALGIRSETLALALLARVHHITATLAKCAKNLSAPVAACAKAVRIMATLRSLTRCSAVAVARPLILACAQLLPTLRRAMPYFNKQKYKTNNTLGISVGSTQEAQTKENSRPSGNYTLGALCHLLRRELHEALASACEQHQQGTQVLAAG